MLAGAIGVVLARNPVHSALMLVMTLFGVAVLFVLQQDPFLAAVQVIVYAGAIVVLFLFVIMFLGVDREENIAAEPLRGQRPLAIGLGRPRDRPGCCCSARSPAGPPGAPHVAGVDGGRPVQRRTCSGKSVYTTYLFPFEATAALLIIAVVGAVVLARRPAGDGPIDAATDRTARTPDPGRRPDRRPLRTPRRPRADRPAPTAGLGRTTGADPPAHPRRHARDHQRRLVPGLSVVLFSIGALGVLVRRNVLVMFMCVELMLNAANLTFVTFARMLHDIGGQVLVFFVLVVAAAEVVVGLGIVVAIFRRRASATADDLHLMKG